MKKLQLNTVFFTLFILQNIIAHNVKAQLSKDFIDRLPDSVKLTTLWKSSLTVREKVNILQTINIVAYKQFTKPYDSIAISLEGDEVLADSTKKIEIEGELTTYYKKVGMLDKSLEHCNAYLQLIKGKKTYAIEQSELVMLKGAMLSSLGRYEESILFLYGALEDYKVNKDSIGIANAFSGLSYPYLSLQLPDTALSYLDSSIAYFGKIDFRSASNKKTWIFFSTMLQNNYLACLLLYEKTGSTKYINKMKEITDILAYQKISCPIPKTFPVLRAYSKGQFDSAINTASLLLAEPITEDYFSNQYKTWILEKYKALSLYNMQHKEKAVILLRSCVDSIQKYIEKTGSSMGFGKYYIDNISGFLYQYYSDKKDWQNAFYFLSLNKQIEDTLAILSNRGRIFEVSQKYNYAKKELAITQLQNDDLLRKKQAMFAIAITIASLLTFVVIAFLLRSKNRELKIKKEQAEQDAKNRIERLHFTSQLQIAELEEKNQLIKIKEKKRLGRELHDNLAGDLAGIKLKLILEVSTAIDTAQQLRLNEIAILVDEAYKTTRAKSHDLFTSSEQNMEDSFVDKIKTIINKGLPDGMFITEIIIDNDSFQNLSLKTRIQLLYIIKEAVINILKHSGADKIQLLLYKDVPGSVLCIADNGKGFDTQTEFKGIGLKSINERVTSINGQLKISSGKTGTEINVIIPEEKSDTEKD